jgi:hypothetical protein
MKSNPIIAKNKIEVAYTIPYSPLDSRIKGVMFSYLKLTRAIKTINESRTSLVSVSILLKFDDVLLPCMLTTETTAIEIAAAGLQL